jgi:putative membrane protein insertion efficiency factor
VSDRAPPLRLVAGPMQAGLIGMIRLYRATLSGWLGGRCRFYPSCSHYAEDAIRNRGVAKGCAMAMWRVLRCNPFGAGGVDQAPGISRHGERQHESLIPSSPPA